MEGSWFFGVLAAMSFAGLLAEGAYSRQKELGWYDAHDTLGNILLGAGNLLLGTAVVAGIGAVWHLVEPLAVVDLNAWLPMPLFWAVGFVLTELIQYTVHRASHRYNWLVWSHVTHHSSGYMNLTTAFRISWFYRMYVWVPYLLLALIGFSFTEFVVFMGIMNGWNLVCHTRFDVSLGPLEGWVVSPRAHRLHHAADSRYAGNYGGALLIWDRLFGTYRAESSDVVEAWGLPEPVRSADPVVLNFHHLRDLATDPGESGFVRALVGTRIPAAIRRVRAPAPGVLGVVGVLGILVFALAFKGLAPSLSAPLHAVGVAVGLVGVLLLGRMLDGVGATSARVEESRSS
jgi:sterol desaturase/sphingolipid hydroxylase (fatty acid hydroxylase superfamily)